MDSSDCIFYDAKGCRIVSGLIGRDESIIDEKACAVCLSLPNAKQVNKVTVSLAHKLIYAEDKQKAKAFLEKYRYVFSSGNKVTQLSNYASALTNWSFAGFPTRTAEEVKYLFETFCSKCDAYNPQEGTCMECGCKVRPRGVPLFNKLAMATESCPRGYFKGISMDKKFNVDATYLLFSSADTERVEQLVEELRGKKWPFSPIIPVSWPALGDLGKPSTSSLGNRDFAWHVGWVSLVSMILDKRQERVAIFHQGYHLDTPYNEIVEAISNDLGDEWDMVVLKSKTFTCDKERRGKFCHAYYVSTPHIYITRPNVLKRLFEQFFDVLYQLAITPEWSNSVKVYMYLPD